MYKQRRLTKLLWMPLIGLIWGLLSINGLEARDTLRVGVHENPPFVIANEEGLYQGLSVDLWQKIAAEKGLDYEWVPYNDLIGIIKALDYREIDLTINPMNVTAQRLQKFDVTQPFFISSIGLATPYISQSQFQVFLKNFFSFDFLQVILLLAFIIFIFGTLLWIVERKNNKYQFRPGILGLFDGLWWSAVTMTTVGYGDKAPKTTFGKTIAIIWMFTAVIIISSFTATIASTLTVSRFESKIETLEDIKLMERVGTIGASSGEDFLTLNQINIHQSYATPIQGLRALAKKEIDILVFDQTILQYLISSYQLGDKVQLLPLTFNKQYQSFILPDNSPHYHAIDAELMNQIQQLSWQQTLHKYNLIAN
jgi:ABC-type amino acid transport substrate-binding protein